MDHSSKSLLLLLFLFSLALLISMSRAQYSPKDFLDPQNAARADKGVPPLAWDEPAAAFARNYANKRAVDCKLVHSNWSGGGENAGIGQKSVAEVVEQWLESPKHYKNIVNPKFVGVGCAMVQCQTGGTFSVCDFTY